MLPSAPEQRGAGIPEAEKPDAGKQKTSLLSLLALSGKKQRRL
jgi:hypothetical protein